MRNSRLGEKQSGIYCDILLTVTGEFTTACVRSLRLKSNFLFPSSSGEKGVILPDHCGGGRIKWVIDGSWCE